MTTLTRVSVRPGKGLAGTVNVPGDKTISHLILVLSALADGDSRIRGFLRAGDTLATLNCLQALGVRVIQDEPLVVHGNGLDGLDQAPHPLDCADAGMAIHLLAGLAAAQHFPTDLDGSPRLRRRPLRRIIDPLRRMGAHIEADNERAPLHVEGAFLHGINAPVISDQDKCGLLVAALFADSPTTIVEPGPLRDHAEHMLRAMGVDVQTDDNTITLTPPPRLAPLDITIPGDIASASFLIVAAVLAARSDVCMQGVTVNPTRTGVLDVLAAMGCHIEQHDVRHEGGEPVADLIIRPAPLTNATIASELAMRAIDELPVLMVAATQARGRTIASEARELRFKDTDRITVMSTELQKLGATIDEREDGFVIIGPQRLRGATVDGHNDHRVAMSLVVAGLAAMGETTVENAECIANSFPDFIDTLQFLGADVQWC